MKSSEVKEKITFNNLFILFLIGSVLGVLIEGSYCLIKKGYWESHVVSMVFMLNILYGLGAVLFYVGSVKLKKRKILTRVLIMTLLVTILELACGLLLREVLGMRAWNYHNRFLNYEGLICLEFSIGWGIVALVFSLVSPFVNKYLNRFNTKFWQVIFITLTCLFMCDFLITGASILRWSKRHEGINASNKIEEILDKKASDEVMEQRFIEWKFLDKI